MIFNKSYLTTFSKNKPYLALASKGKIIDSKFTLNSELSLYDYAHNVHYTPLQTDVEYCKVEWCENLLASGHTNGTMSLFEPCSDLSETSDSFKLIKNFEGLTGKVLGLDFNKNKNVIAAGSANGNLVFLNLDKLDQQYKCDIPIEENITCLAWNNQVSRILAVGTATGNILILDLRAKEIVKTLQSKDIKDINNIKWHPKCSTTIFASSNLNDLACFKLESNSLTKIGKFKSPTINFDILNQDTAVCCSDNEIKYINVDTFEIKEKINTENAFDISFSKKDPIYCSSYNSGTTEVFSNLCKNFNLGKAHLQINNKIVGPEIYKINTSPLKINVEENIEKKIIDILYSEEEFKFDENSRKEIGKLFLENRNIFPKSSIKNEGFIFDLQDDVVKNLITKNFEDVKIFNEKKINLNFVIDLMIKNNKVDPADSLEFLVCLAVNKEYEEFWKKISSDQWTIMIAILLYSDLNNGKVLEIIRNISEYFKIPILNLIYNDSKEYFNSRNISTDLPDKIFDVKDFFGKYGNEIFSLKKLNNSYDNPIINEYFWYAISHNMFGEMKDFNFKDEIIRNYIGKEQETYKKVDEVEKKLSNVTLTAPMRKPIIENKVQQEQKKVPEASPAPVRPPLYGAPNKSVASFSTKPVPETSSQKPLYGVPNKSVTAFSTKPTTETSPQTLNKPAPPKKSLYSGVFNRSATSFSTKPDTSVSTYGQQKPVQSPPQSNVSSIPKPFNKSPVIPQPVNQTPSSNNTRNTEENIQTNFDAIYLSKKFEEVFESLKEKASKKNNLIVGNKIKDAVRRFQVFQQTNKNDLSMTLLSRMNQILEIINSEMDKTSIKTKVRGIVDECSEIKNQQCDIWLPSIAILVQLVY
ncbi:protein transport protein SEC31A [Vairimorpha necatrix]|uniref:Protein transport protein SEC31 n=1 Tax=Vairimorpha necatrix TaxID=6039 RepID=A0AAX4J9B4_9MICR